MYSNILSIVLFCVRSLFTLKCQIAGSHIFAERSFPLSQIQRYVLLYRARVNVRVLNSFEIQYLSHNV